MEMYYATVKADTDTLVPTGTRQVLAWTSALLDTGIFWHASHPTRVTISGAVTMARVTAHVVWGADPNGFRMLSIRKNGGAFPGRGLTHAVAVSGMMGMDVQTALIPVVSNDYFELECAAHDAGGPATILGARSWLSIEGWEAWPAKE